jgi:hypothetical protein
VRAYTQLYDRAESDEDVSISHGQFQLLCEQVGGQQVYSLWRPLPAEGSLRASLRGSMKGSPAKLRGSMKSLSPGSSGSSGSPRDVADDDAEGSSRSDIMSSYVLYANDCRLAVLENMHYM